MTQEKTIRHRTAELERREAELERKEAASHNREGQARRQARRAGSAPREPRSDPRKAAKAALEAYNYEARRDQVLKIFSRELRIIRARYGAQATSAMARSTDRDALRARAGSASLSKFSAAREESESVYAEIEALADARASREEALAARVEQTDLHWDDVEQALDGQAYLECDVALPGSAATDLARARIAVQRDAQAEATAVVRERAQAQVEAERAESTT